MRITGNKRSGRHLLKNIGKLSTEVPAAPKVWWRKPLKIVAIVTAVLIVLSAGAYAYIKLGIKPPDVNLEPRDPVNPAPGDPLNPAPPDVAPGNAYDPAGTATPNTRDTTKFTFLVLGFDQESGNSDVIMVATFDTTNYTFEVVNIPRDTMMNVKWVSKKVNAVYSFTRREFRGQDDIDSKTMDATTETFADILGFEVDYWVTVDMRGFVALINAIGGVDFYIPSDMEYHDSLQNLHISYRRGMKYGLTGQQALEILRYRRYSDADIRRISNQQSFLKAAAEQIIAKKNSISVIDLANIFLRHVKTDLSLNNLIWLGREFLKLNAENINFTTMPGNYQDSVNGASYVSIYVDEWLEIVNSKLSPFSVDFTEKDVSILTRGPDRKLYVTDGNRQGDASWGASSRGPASSTSGSGSSGGGGSSSAGSGSSSGGSGGSGQTSGSQGGTDSNPGDDLPNIDEIPPDDVPDTSETPPVETPAEPGDHGPGDSSGDPSPPADHAPDNNDTPPVENPAGDE